MVVLKFGGTSVGEPAAIRRVLGIIAAEPRRRLVVVSAFSGVTDGLLQMAAGGPSPAAGNALDALLDRHLAAARMVRDEPARTALESELRRIAARVAAVLETSGGRLLEPAARDEVVSAGELWSSRVLAALLRDQGIPAEWVDARHVLKTDSRHGGAAPDLEATRDAAARFLVPILSAGVTGVLGGFIGSDAHGRTTTLGRGGSDYSAAVLGSCLDAAEIQIWTDVDGVLTADPRILPQARLVARLSYGEAHDLASYGAKVLHPGTITPAVHRGIPVLVRNSHNPAAQGTLVTDRERVGRRDRVAGLAGRAGITLLEATAHQGTDPGELTRRLFDHFQAAGTEAIFAERCGDRIALTTEAEALSAPDAVRDVLAGVADVRIRTSLATIVVVGEGLASDQGLAGDARAALGDVTVYLTTRPAGGRTLAFVVDQSQVPAAMGRLHDRLFGMGRERASVSCEVVQA
jgi:aspartate kinase